MRKRVNVKTTDLTKNDPTLDADTLQVEISLINEEGEEEDYQSFTGLKKKATEWRHTTLLDYTQKHSG